MATKVSSLLAPAMVEPAAPRAPRGGASQRKQRWGGEGPTAAVARRSAPEAAPTQRENTEVKGVARGRGYGAGPRKKWSRLHALLRFPCFIDCDALDWEGRALGGRGGRAAASAAIAERAPRPPGDLFVWAARQATTHAAAAPAGRPTRLHNLKKRC